MANYETQVTHDGTAGTLSASNHRLAFMGDSGNLSIYLGYDDITGVEMRREPLDWGSLITGFALLLGAFTAFIVSDSLGEFASLALIIAFVSVIGAIILIGYGLERYRVMTIWTPATSFDFQNANSGDAKAVAKMVQS